MPVDLAVQQCFSQVWEIEVEKSANEPALSKVIRRCFLIASHCHWFVCFVLALSAKRLDKDRIDCCCETEISAARLKQVGGWSYFRQKGLQLRHFFQTLAVRVCRRGAIL